MRTCQLRPKSQIKREPTNEFKGRKTAYENLQTSIENIGGCSGVRVHSCRGGQSYSQQAKILHVRMSRRRQRLWPRHWCAWHQPGGDDRRLLRWRQQTAVLVARTAGQRSVVEASP